LVEPDPQAEAQGVNLGLRFGVMRAGRILGVSFWRHSADMNGPHIGSLWQLDGTGVAHAHFPPMDMVQGWNSVRFNEPFECNPTSPTQPVYLVASALTNSFSLTDNFFNNQLAGAWDHENQTVIAGGGIGGTHPLAPNLFVPAANIPTDGLSGNGLFAYGGNNFPNQSYQNRNYYVDVLFETE